MKPCRYADCPHQASVRGLCNLHYQRERAHPTHTLDTLSRHAKALIAACEGVYKTPDVARHFETNTETVLAIWRDDTKYPEYEPPNIIVAKPDLDLVWSDVPILLARGLTVAEAAAVLGVKEKTIRNLGRAKGFDIIEWGEGFTLKARKKTPPPAEQQCLRCHATKPITAFVLNRYDPTGYTRLCRECRNVENKQRRHGIAQPARKRVYPPRTRRAPRDVHPWKKDHGGFSKGGEKNT